MSARTERQRRPREVSWLHALAESAREELLRLGHVRRYEKGDVLIRFGAANQSVHILGRGRVKVVVPTTNGWQALLAVRGAGEVVGELAALDGRTRSASVVALEPVESVLIPAADFVRHLEEHPRTSLALLRALAGRLRDTDERSSQAGGTTVAARLARRLLELADVEGRPVKDGVLIDAPLSQQDIADWIGASREAVAHALRGLREAGAVRTGRMEITLTDLDVLRDAAGL